MTTRSEARESIYKAFNDVWSVGPVTPYTFDNEDFDPPKNASWVRLVVRHEPSAQETLGRVGNRRFERSGTVLVQVFCPLNRGTSAADALVQTLTEVFEGVTLADSGVRFTAVTAGEQGPQDGWELTLFEAPFKYDERR